MMHSFPVCRKPPFVLDAGSLARLPSVPKLLPCYNARRPPQAGHLGLRPLLHPVEHVSNDLLNCRVRFSPPDMWMPPQAVRRSIPSSSSNVNCRISQQSPVSCETSAASHPRRTLSIPASTPAPMTPPSRASRRKTLFPPSCGPARITRRSMNRWHCSLKCG
jgi:hypothetical protein